MRGEYRQRDPVRTCMPIPRKTNITSRSTSRTGAVLLREFAVQSGIILIKKIESGQVNWNNTNSIQHCYLPTSEFQTKYPRGFFEQAGGSHAQRKTVGCALFATLAAMQICNGYCGSLDPWRRQRVGLRRERRRHGPAGRIRRQRQPGIVEETGGNGAAHQIAGISGQAAKDTDKRRCAGGRRHDGFDQAAR
jgi:hypothetical protein